VIGINTAIRGDAQNIGFAIQVNKLRDLIPDLLNPAQAAKLDMPIRLKEIRKTSAPSNVQATIVQADSKTPVEAIAGKKPRDIVDAYAMLLAQKENEPFTVTLANGKRIELTPHVAPTPDAIVLAKERLGMTVEELTPMTAQKYGLIDEDGMLVTQVARGSVAARAGIQPGDVILMLGRYPVTSLKQFSNLMEHLPDSGNVRIGVSRGGQRGWGTLQL
jgi:S1-C subfamily serine protease